MNKLTVEQQSERLLIKNIELLSAGLTVLQASQVRCTLCGFIWTTTYNKLQQGSGCRQCWINSRTTSIDIAFEFCKNKTFKPIPEE